MTIIQTILFIAGIFSWVCVGGIILICSIQSFIYDRKREKREEKKAEQDDEYHTIRMKDLRK